MKAFLLIITLLFLPLTSQAQLGGDSFLNSGASIILEPEYPGPRDEVTAQLYDYRSAAYGSEVQWYYDDTLISNENAQEISFAAPALGKSATIRAVVYLANGTTETYTKTIRPAYLDIIVEARTHVPSFYQGMPLPSVESTVDFIAILDTGKAPAGNLIYTWSLNGKNIQGNGNRATAIMPSGKGASLKLRVSSLGVGVVAERNIFISSTRPKIHFYELSALYGMSSRTANEFSLIGDNITIQAEPYYLDSSVFNNADLMEWEINDKKVTSGSNNPYEITLERTGYSGTARISFHVRSLSNLLQGVEEEVNLNI